MKRKREEYIEKNQNLELLESVFQISYDNKTDSWRDSEGYPNGSILSVPNYIETEKLSALFHSKGGSSVIKSFFKPAKYVITTSNKEWEAWYKCFSTAIKVNAKGKSDEKLKPIGDFQNIIEGKSNKQFVIALRNPVYHWLSGVCEDLKGELTRHNLTRGLIAKNQPMSTSLFDLDFNKQELKYLSDDVFNESLKTFLIGMLTKAGHLRLNHSLLYNETYWNFLNLNPNIDKSKLHIVDIDSPDGNLEDVWNKINNKKSNENDTEEFDKYFHTHNNYVRSHRADHERVLKGIQRISFNGSPIKRMLLSTVKRDLYYYSLIKQKYQTKLI